MSAKQDVERTRERQGYSDLAGVGAEKVGRLLSAVLQGEASDDLEKTTVPGRRQGKWIRGGKN